VTLAPRSSRSLGVSEAQVTAYVTIHPRECRAGQTTRVEVDPEPFPYGPDAQWGECRACGKRILWGKLPGTAARGSVRSVPLDPEPHPWGQMILLRNGRSLVPVEIGALHGPEIQDRRFRDHRTTCQIGPRNTWTLQAALRSSTVPSASKNSEHVRAIKLQLEKSAHP
jgi:hypothetical protein